MIEYHYKNLAQRMCPNTFVHTSYTHFRYKESFINIAYSNSEAETSFTCEIELPKTPIAPEVNFITTKACLIRDTSELEMVLQGEESYQHFLV